MTLRTALLLAAALFELAGIGTVIYGISETGAKFTEKPSVVVRFGRFVGRWVSKLRRRRSQTVALAAGGTVAMGADRSIRATRGFPNWQNMNLHDRIERLRHAVEGLNENLHRALDQIDAEK